MECINIAYITDDGYAMPTGVSLTSLKANKDKDTKYIVHIFCNDVSKKNEEKFMFLADSDFEIHVHRVQVHENMEEMKVGRKRVTTSALLKFKLPLLLPNLENVIYIDGDTIIQKDLTELSRIGIDDYFVCAVKDCISIGNPKHLEKLGLDMDDFYFNSGVMFLNLLMMRKFNITEQLISYRINNYNHFMDQDALNVVLHGKVKFISWKYNALNKFFYKYPQETLNDFYDYVFCDRKELVFHNSCIVHYGDDIKPWDSRFEEGYLKNLFSLYQKLSPYYDESARTTSKNETLIDEASYKIGRAITFLPRKIIGGFRCIKQHTLKYTFLRLLYHLHIIKWSYKYEKY